jgi:glycosyltransferase involved in cell wall biosynthesis
LSPLRVGLDVLPLAGRLTGVGRFCAGLAGALVAGREVELHPYAVARRGSSVLVGPAGDLGLEVRTWPVPTRAVNALWARSDLVPVEWLVGPVEVVHGTNYVVPPARNAGRVVTVHDLTALRYPEMCLPASLAYPAIVQRAARRGAFVHVPSRFVGDEVVELLGVSPDMVRVIPHGIDQAPPGGGGGGAGAGARRAPYVLALGAVEPRKDIPSLVEAFAEVALTHKDLELVVAGPKGWGEGAFEAAVAASGVAGRIVRLGYLQEAERLSLLAGAAVLAYPSLYEGFGFPPLEAMVAGVPVVASAAGAVPEVVGDAAELVVPGDSAALGAALARVLDDGGLRQKLTEAGRARAAGFTWAASAAAMTDLYRQSAPGRALP